MKTEGGKPPEKTPQEFGLALPGELKSIVEAFHSRSPLPANATDDDVEIRNRLTLFFTTGDQEILSSLELKYPFLVSVTRNIPAFPDDVKESVSA